MAFPRRAPLWLLWAGPGPGPWPAGLFAVETEAQQRPGACLRQEERRGPPRPRLPAVPAAL